MYGSDQAASLEEPGLKRLVTTLRKLPTYIGSKRDGILECEINVAKKLRYWER
jgi:sialic acid synthase SpsE